MIVGIGLGGKSGSTSEGPRSERLHVARMRLFRFTSSAYVMGGGRPLWSGVLSSWIVIARSEATEGLVDGAPGLLRCVRNDDVDRKVLSRRVSASCAAAASSARRA